MKEDIKNYDYEELKNIFIELNEKPYRAGQFFTWIYKKQVASFSDISVYSKALRHILDEKYTLISLYFVKKHISMLDNSVKFLFKLKDGYFIESVLLPTEKRLTICLSTQAGCRMGCIFCATAGVGYKRNLETGEIVEQLLYLNKYALKNYGRRITNIVFMGMGEPFDNYENVLKSAHIINNEKGINISTRKITISTAGLLPKIKLFFLNKEKFMLAISMNSPFKKERDILMPINKKYDIREIIRFLKKIKFPTNYRITFEYIMLKNNISKAHADEIIKLFENGKFKLNLIPYNEIQNRYKHNSKDFPLLKATALEMNRFYSYFLNTKIQVMIRNSMGQDIQGSCGMLSASYEDI